jgi:hypothetical protein
MIEHRWMESLSILVPISRPNDKPQSLPMSGQAPHMERRRPSACPDFHCRVLRLELMQRMGTGAPVIGHLSQCLPPSHRPKYVGGHMRIRWPGRRDRFLLHSGPLPSSPLVQYFPGLDFPY